jgi:hypothetical protein
LRYCIPLAVVTFLGLSSRAHAAEPPKEIADLFPAGTLAYAEFHNAPELSQQLAAVFKGTVVEDSIPFIHSRKDAAKSMMELTGKRQVAFLGLLGSPEMLAEFKRLRIAAGLTGFTDNGDPDGAIVILTHDSPAAGLAARAFITMSQQVRKVGEVAKVPIFQYRTPNITYDPNGNMLIQNDKPFADGAHEMTVAYTPGLFVIGTSKTAVGHSIKRFIGEEKGVGLGSSPLFKEAVAANRQTGLFFFLNYPEFSAKLSAATRTRGMPRGANGDILTMLNGGDADLFESFNLVANAKAVKSVAGCVKFRDGGLAMTAAAVFDPAHKSPLIDFLSGPGAKVEWLQHARRPATLACAVSFPEKNRAETVIAFLDAITKSKGEVGRLPRDIVRDLHDKYKLDVAGGLIGKVRAATIVIPTNQELPKGGKPGPMIVLHCDEATVAGAWEEFFPKLLADLAGAAAVPQSSTETINGIRVYTVSGAGLRWNAPVHFARSGSAVAVGLDRKLVAAAVTSDAASSVFGGDKLVSPPSGDPAALFGVIALGEVIPGWIDQPRPNGPVVPIGEDQPPVMPNGQPVPENVIEEMKKARKDLAAALTSLSPATVTARLVKNELRVEIFQPKVQNGALKGVIDASANLLDRNPFFGGNRQFDAYDLRGRW